jgi:hypothetical protein
MRLLVWCAVTALAGTTLGATAQMSAPTDVGKVTGALLQNYPWLLDEAGKTAVDDTHRRIREAESTLRRRDASPEAKAEAEAAIHAAEASLAEILPTQSSVVRAAIGDASASLTPPGPFELPGDTGAILLRVENAAGAEASPPFAFVNVNLSEYEGTIDIPGGTGWAILGLTNIPRDRTILKLRFTRDGAEGPMTLVSVLTPQPGRIKINILSDDTGESTPAMLRLLRKIDGQVRKPNNGIDFNPQFDHQGNRSRVANLPGKLKGEYWCVPGPVDMVLPAGEWEVTVRRGAEHVPAIETLTVPPNETVERTYRPRRWVDMRKLGWYSGDDHVHCQILGEADAERLMTWALAEDVHLLNVVKMGDIYRTWFEQRGFGKDFRVIRDDYILSPGQECPRTHAEFGHTLAMNITSMIRDTDRYYLYDAVFDQVHAQGGLTGYAHAGWGGFHVHRDMSMNIPKGKVDFLELLQFADIDTDLYFEFLNLGFKVTASAGSDVPWGGTVGEVRIYAHTGTDGEFTADRWFEAVRNGRTFVTNGPMLEFRVNDALPGDELRLDGDQPLRVRARAWGDPEATVPARLEIVRHGEVVKSVEASDGGSAELTLDFELDPGDGCWIAARAEGQDGTKAHTTPVYAVRPGLRFWKFDDVPALIEKRLASLDEIEALLKEYQAADAAGELETDRARKQFVVLGPEILERVEAARAIYRDLQATAEKEKSQRTQ